MLEMEEETWVRILNRVKKQGFRNVLLLDEEMFKGIPQYIKNHSIHFKLK